MAERNAVLIDNTTIDSACRVLSKGEIERRQDKRKGWCLRDISDLSCLSAFLDALIYFDDLYTVPLGDLPSTVPITSAGSPAEGLRKYVHSLPLKTDWGSLAQESEQVVASLLGSDPALRQAVAMPSLSRAVYSFGRRRDGSTDIYPHKSPASDREARIALQRALLYLSAGEAWRGQVKEANLPVWLSPERFLLVRRFSPEARQAAMQHESFNFALAGNLAELIPTAPSLITMLALAERKGENDFASFFMDQVEKLRSERDLGGLRSFFNSSLVHPMTRSEIEEWANYKSLQEKIIDLIGLIPGVGDFLAILLQWVQEPALKAVASATGWYSDQRAILRSVTNECRYLKVNEVVKLVRKYFAGYPNEEDHYYAYEIGHCVNTFINLVAGGNEFDRELDAGDEFDRENIEWPIIECI